MTPLQKKTYELLKTVPKGRVTTYKALAHKLGTRGYRAVGQFMRTNPYGFIECHDADIQVPCHRVVASDGSLGGFMGGKTEETLSKKIALLEQEGVSIVSNKVVHFPEKLYTFN